MLNFNKAKQLVAILAAASFVLGGCTYESAPKYFPAEEAQKMTSTEQGAAQKTLADALTNAKTNKDAQKFWYNGYIKNTILSRSTTGMYEGVVMNPDSYLVSARIATQSYQYFRTKDQRYIKYKENWLTAKEEPLPIDVLRGFDDWYPFLDQAVQLEDEKIIGTLCTPYQIKINAADWLKGSKNPVFDPLKKELSGRADMDHILNTSTVKMTFWIGKEDHLIHQYQTWIIMPLPGAGFMDQEVMFRFYKYNDPGIESKLPKLDEIQKYLLK